MIQKKAKLISFAIALIFVFTTAACGAVPTTSPTAQAVSETPVNDKAPVTYPLPGNQTLSLAIVEQAAVVANAKTLGDTHFGQELMRLTGVNIEYQHPANNEAFNLMFASGNLPDIIFFNFTSYGVGRAINDGIIYPITDIIEEHAPDLNDVLDSNPIYRKMATTPGGDIPGFPFIRGDEKLMTSSGLIIREDWLKDLDMEIPVTVDELYDALVGFKEIKGATVPLSTINWRLRAIMGDGLITSAFDLPAGGWYHINGKVENGWYKNELKDVLVWMHKLYEEGLLDPNFVTLDDTTANSNFMNGLSGVLYQGGGAGIGNFMATMAEKDPNFSAVGFGPLTKNHGETAMSTGYTWPVTGDYAVITPAAKDKELAARFLNFGYTPEGRRFYNFGTEGVSYELVDGLPAFTELITKNPDGLSFQYALAQYGRSWAADAFVQDPRYLTYFYALPQQQKSLEYWTKSKAAEYRLPTLNIPDELVSENTTLNADVNTYSEEMVIKFITGDEPLTNFDTYMQTLKTIGVERLIEIRQIAYDEFLSR